jgi:hypothetical protein
MRGGHLLEVWDVGEGGETLAQGIARGTVLGNAHYLLATQLHTLLSLPFSFSFLSLTSASSRTELVASELAPYEAFHIRVGVSPAASPGPVRECVCVTLHRACHYHCNCLPVGAMVRLQSERYVLFWRPAI